MSASLTTVPALPPPQAFKGSKTLQDLAAAKTIQVLREDEDGIQTWNSLGSDAQQVLFPYLWEDYRQLHKRDAYLSYLERRDFFRSQWRFYEGAGDDLIKPASSESWDLVPSLDQKRPVSICSGKLRPHPLILRPRKVVAGAELDLMDLLGPKGFGESLVSVVGAPPLRLLAPSHRNWRRRQLELGHNAATEILVHRGRSMLHFSRKELRYWGLPNNLQEDVEGALDLLNWLISEECPKA